MAMRFASSGTGRRHLGVRGQVMVNRRAVVEAMEGRTLLASVTLITHGFGSGIRDWVNTMANEIAALHGALASQPIYSITAVDPSHAGGEMSVSAGRMGPQPPSWGSGDIVLLLDWSDMAGTADLSPTAGVRSTVDVAAAVAAKFFDPAFIPGFGHALAELPVHLIGHSRGGSLVNELSRDLGKQGVWVDQLTTLDPHPVDGLFGGDIVDWDDAPMSVPYNVIFADNYWRSDVDPLDFDGESIPGSHNTQLSEGILTGDGYTLEHSDVHLWYNGTIPPYADSDGGKSVNPTTWYSSPHPSRYASGYVYAQDVDERPLDGLWPTYGGTAARYSVWRDGQGTQWPNIDQLSLRHQVSGTISTDERIFVSYRYQDYDSSATITLYTDSDTNPYNGFSGQLPGNCLPCRGTKV